MSTERISAPRPTVEELDQELKRRKHIKSCWSALWSTIWILVVAAAATVLFATYFVSVLRIDGGSMNPTLEEGQYVVAVRSKKFKTGDVVAFYYNNQILLKRVIATSGEWVDIKEDGSVYVDEELLEEPYLEEKEYGDSDLSYPYQVPESRLFVMGDHRSSAADSRLSMIGTITSDQIVGKVIFRVWPLTDLGTI